MAQNALLVYATGSRLPRRLIIPDDDTELLSLAPFLGPGESGRVFPQTQIATLKAAAVLAGVDIGRMVLAALLAVPVAQIPSGRCCVIDSGGNVVNLIHADPALDAVDGHTLVSSDVANIGWTWDGTHLIAPPRGLKSVAEEASIMALPVTPIIAPVIMPTMPVIPL